MHADLIKCRLNEYNAEDSTRAILKNKHIKISKNKIIYMLHKSILYFTSYNLFMFLFFFKLKYIRHSVHCQNQQQREQTQFMLNKNG